MPTPFHEAGAAVAQALPLVDERGLTVRISVLTRVGCHLCDRALALIDDVSVSTQVGYAALDVDIQEPSLRADLITRYGEQLPVTFVDGKPHDYWSVDPMRLQRALAAG